jgi:hypothetical protein
MTSASRAGLTLLVGSVLVAGCIAPVASSSAPPSPAPRTTPAPPTRTPNPNELARQSRSPSASVAASPTVDPRPTTSPRPTPTGPTEMQQLIPILVNGGGASPEVIRGEDLVGNGDAQAMAFARMLERLGATPDQFEGAGSSCCSGTVTVFDLRVLGVAPERVADEFVAAGKDLDPGVRVVTRTVTGATVRRLRWPAGSGRTDTDVVVLRGVVFAFAGPADQQANVDATIAFMRRPPLEALLPATIDGQAVQRGSMPASGLIRGGDMCSFVCPGEGDAFATAIEVPVEQIDFAYATSQAGALVIAFRVPGASNAKLVAARIASFRKGKPPFGREDRKIGGKTVTWVSYSGFDSAFEREYLYASGHVLYSIRPAVDDGPPPAAVSEAIAALP